MERKTIFIIKILTLLICVISVVSDVNDKNMPLAILLFLILLLNMQLRTLRLNKKFIMGSIMVDLLMVGIIYNQFSGISYLPLFITVIDGIILADRKPLAIPIIVLIACGYYSVKNQNILSFVNYFILMMVTLFAIAYQRMSQKIKELEHLYDDVRKYSYELENAKMQIEKITQQTENLALVKERQRISVEIHDTIGHRLTALLMQLEAGVRLLDIGQKSGRELIGESVENLRESIDVLRNTVKSIKPKEYKNFIYSLEEMNRRFTKETGVHVEFAKHGDAISLYPGVEMVLYKNTQEALTNAVRHGKANNISIHLYYLAHAIELTIQDDGKGTGSIHKGMGMNAMEERLKFIGGSLQIVSGEGFTVINRVPIEAKTEH